MDNIGQWTTSATARKRLRLQEGPGASDFRKAQRWTNEINRGQIVGDDPEQRCANDKGAFGRNEVSQKYVVLVQGTSPMQGLYCRLCGKWVPNDLHFYTDKHRHKISSGMPSEPRKWFPTPGPEAQDLNCVNHITFTSLQLTPGIDRQRAITSQKEKVREYRERARGELAPQIKESESTSSVPFTS